MRIQSINQNNHQGKPNFKAEIKAPDALWRELSFFHSEDDALIISNALQRIKSLKFKNPIEFTQRTYYTGWDTDRIYKATIRDSEKTESIESKEGWTKLLIKVANQYSSQRTNLNSLIKDLISSVKA